MTHKTPAPEQVDDAVDLEAAVIRRANVLHHVLDGPSTMALAAEVPMSGLLDYIAGLQALGLLDKNQRLTAAGAFYRVLVSGAVAEIKAGETLTSVFDVRVPRRWVWNRIGGEEAHLEEAERLLRFADLIHTHGDGATREYAVLPQ